MKNLHAHNRIIPAGLAQVRGVHTMMLNGSKTERHVNVCFTSVNMRGITPYRRCKHPRHQPFLRLKYSTCCSRFFASAWVL